MRKQITALLLSLIMAVGMTESVCALPNAALLTENGEIPAAKETLTKAGEIPSAAEFQGKTGYIRPQFIELSESEVPEIYEPSEETVKAKVLRRTVRAGIPILRIITTIY